MRNKMQLNDILDGKHPTYQTLKLKKRMILESLLEEKCEMCSLTEWQGKVITLQLDHINGINNDHRRENLRLLCPNCHSQTDTYAGKNKQKTAKVKSKTTKSKTAILREKRMEIVMNSNIDFSIRGWVKNLSEELDMLPQKVNSWMKKNMLEFYDEKCNKRKYRH